MSYCQDCLQRFGVLVKLVSDSDNNILQKFLKHKSKIYLQVLVIYLILKIYTIVDLITGGK